MIIINVNIFKNLYDTNNIRNIDWKVIDRVILVYKKVERIIHF